MSITPPVANAAMLIRRPVANVYEAFVDPAITTRFWFTKGSGRLDEGKPVTWEWEMYGVASRVNVLNLEKNKRIKIEWSSRDESNDPPTTVEWTFESHGPDSTFVNVTESGFRGTDDEIVAAALGSTGGFTWVLAGLKALLEHDIELNLVADRFPAGINST